MPVPATPVVTRVEWLPSGSGTGIVRVGGRGRLEDADLPELLVTASGRSMRIESLPDGGSEPGAWRAAFVIEEVLLAAAGVELALVFPGGASVELPPPPVEALPLPSAPESPGGEVIERAVLAERRARRAEAAEQAQTRIAERALRAVEVLEGRAAEIDRRLADDRGRARRAARSPRGGGGRRTRRRSRSLPCSPSSSPSAAARTRSAPTSRTNAAARTLPVRTPTPSAASSPPPASRWARCATR